uniref:Uncharacterized protein n=1 Tax=Arundo donax TaxID=35708 RepID=A0A0A8Y3M8_ARUDO
MQTQPCSVRNQ